MMTYSEIAQKIRKHKKVTKVPVNSVMGVYIISDKDNTVLPFYSRALKKSSIVNFPDFLDDIAYIWKDAETREPFIKLTVDEIERLSYFTADPKTETRYHFYFPWVWYDDELKKTWVVATDQLRAIMYRNRKFSQAMDDVKKTFPFPPLWELNRIKTVEIVLFPDINGRSYIKLSRDWRTLAVMWWEISEPLNISPPFSGAIYPVVGIKKPPEGFTFKTLGRIQIEKKYDPTSPVVYIDGKTALNKGDSVQVTMDFEPEHPIQFSGDILQLNLNRTYTLSLCRKLDDEDIVGWYSFRLESDPSKEEEYIIFPSRVPDDVIQLPSDDRTSYYKG